MLSLTLVPVVVGVAEHARHDLQGLAALGVQQPAQGAYERQESWQKIAECYFDVEKYCGSVSQRYNMFQKIVYNL